jgi:hypothetical protein
MIMAATYGKNSLQAGFDSRADLNGDEKVGYADLLIFAANYGK